MATVPEVRPYPEWRQLKANIEPLLESKSQFSYDELKELSGVDIRTMRGRQHFYKFRRIALKEWKVWFENSPGFGYVMIPAGEQPKAAIKRVGAARRRVKVAQQINASVRPEQLTQAQLLLQAQTGALIADLAHAFNRASRQLSAVAAKYKLEISADQLKALTESPEIAKKSPGAAAPKFRIDMPDQDLQVITGRKKKA
jgi:hypothetical protein